MIARYAKAAVLAALVSLLMLAVMTRKDAQPATEPEAPVAETPAPTETPEAEETAWVGPLRDTATIPEAKLPAQEEPEEELEPVKFYREDVPLSEDLQAALDDICQETGVDINLALGLIQTESNFHADIVSPTGDYGLCQLNYRYFDPTMTPEDNLRSGIGLLGQHLQTYGDTAAALTAYNRGHDDGTRYYASVVLSNAAGWGYGG